MADAKHTHRVTHPSLYLRGKDGKLQQVEVGTLLTKDLGEKLAKTGRAEPIGAEKALAGEAEAEAEAGKGSAPPPPAKGGK